MPCCVKCGCCTSHANLDNGRCCICAAEKRGEKPVYTLPRDEWEEYTPAERRELRKQGISPETGETGGDPNVPTGFQ